MTAVINWVYYLKTIILYHFYILIYLFLLLLLLFLFLIFTIHFQKCSLCSPLSDFMSHPTAIVQCSHGRCTKPFHVSCGFLAGAKFEISDWPVPIYISCLKHVATIQKAEGRHASNLTDLNINDSALAKHRNRRFYWAQVIGIVRNRQYAVDFDDGSFSEDLMPEDVVVNFKIFIQFFNYFFKGIKSGLCYYTAFYEKQLIQNRLKNSIRHLLTYA